MSTGSDEVEMEENTSKDGAAADAAAAPKAEGDVAAAPEGDKPADAETVGGDAAADEWASMLDEKAEGGSSERVLNQNEIDNLLGFDEAGGGDKDRTGIQAIVNSALVSYERLPLLEIVFDRLVRLMTTSLRNFTSDNVEVSLDNISSIRFGDYLNSIPLPAILAVFRAEELDNYGLITVDSSLIYSIVDVLLGGRRGTAAMRVEGRTYTTIERSLVQRMLEVVLQDLKVAFEPVAKVRFDLDRIEINPRFAAIARPANAAVLVKLRVDMEDRGGRVELLLPYATLEPIRELLLQMFMGEKFGRDSIWESHLATELWRTNVDIEAVLDELPMTLNQVMNLEVGQTVLLNVGPDAPIELRCGGVGLLTGKMGRVGHNVSVRVENAIKNRRLQEGAQ
jgi:flagellar motor switch protein FliM